MIEITDFTTNSLVYKHQITNLNFGLFDMGNVLYHGNYLPICEHARENFLFNLGTSYGSIMKEGFHLPIVHLEQKFIKPLFYEKSYHLDLHILLLTKSKIKFGYLIKKNEDESIINITTTLLTCVKNTDGEFKVHRFPEILTNLLDLNFKAINE